MHQLKKYRRHALKIKNTLYKRFTLSNRGFTPISFKTRHLNYSFDAFKRVHYFYSPYSRRSGRIYRLDDKDIRFDFSSCRVSEDLVEISKGLDPSNVCAVVFKNNLITYMFPFKENTGRGLYTENSQLFYPGLYYSRGMWLWTRDLSPSLNGLEGDRYASRYSTDYTRADDRVFVKGEGKLEKLKYFIYIPFDSIKTTAVQAYLPLCTIPYFCFNKYRGEDPDIVTLPMFQYNCVSWMGKGITLHIEREVEHRVPVLTENYSEQEYHLVNSLATPSQIRSLIQQYIDEVITSETKELIGYGVVSSIDISLPQYSPDHYPTSQTYPEIYVHTFASHTTEHVNNYLSPVLWTTSTTQIMGDDWSKNVFRLPNSYNNVGNKGYVYALVYRGGNAMTGYRYVELFINQPYYNVLDYVTREEDSLFDGRDSITGKYYHEDLVAAIYNNSIPIDSTIAHLSRINVY